MTADTDWFRRREDERLTEAFHLLMDVRDDTHSEGVEVDMTTAIRAIQRAMRLRDYIVPNRNRGEGR